jgi:CTP:molybdopterin cytidylyltransferase MocA
LIPTSNGRKGHPVIFPKTLVGEIIDTDPKGATLKDIFSKHSDIINLLPIERNEILVDMDTKDDYKDVLKLYEHF